MMSVAVGEMLWVVCCSRIRGRPGKREACVEGGSGREGSQDSQAIMQSTYKHAHASHVALQ